MSTFISGPDIGAVRAVAGTTRVAVKDLIDMAGAVTTCGSRVLASQSPPAAADAECLRGVRAAQAAGRAVVVGRTNLHELAFGVSGVNPWYGTPVNPLDPARVPGGSSSGSAVAVATGVADVAIGSDTGGSIRIPATCCGVVGLKTTHGRVSLAGVQPLAPSLDTVGPMGATVAAAALGMELLEPGFEWRAAPAAQRIGRLRLAAAPWIDTAIDSALTRWSRLGGTVTDVALPGWDAADRAASVILMAEAWGVHGELWRRHRSELSADVAQRLEAASAIGGAEVASARAQGRRWSAEMGRALAAVDLIVLPVLAEAPPLLDDAARTGAIRHTAPINLSGLPAVSLPVWPAGGGLPAGLQLVGPAGSEATLLATALAIEGT